MNKHTQMTAQQLKPYIGTMKQLAGVRTSVLDDGRGRGVRVADFDNGGGLAFQVLLDRGLDIGRATFKGIPLSYLAAAGVAHPSFYEPDGFRWLRNFGGGLLTGCGLANVGIPEAETGMRVAGPLGLHGRLSNTPGEQIAVTEAWEAGQYRLQLSGLLREASFFTENMECRRTISTALGCNSITLCDHIANRGVRPAPLMLLYHINTGFPLLSEHAVLNAQLRSTTPRNEIAVAGLAAWRHGQPPTANYVEQCFFHDIEPDADGLARMALTNPDCGLMLEVAYRKTELPFFTQWKMMGQQEYVMGLEPANCHPDGQAAEMGKGTLKILQPDESTECFLKITLGQR